MSEFFRAYGAIAAVAGVAAGFLWLLLTPEQRRRFLPLQSLRDVHWRGGEVSLAFFIYLLAAALSLSLFDSVGFYDRIYGAEPSHVRKVLWSSLMALPFTLALTYFCLFTISQTRPSDIGMTLSRWRQNAIVGYLFWLVLTPSVLGVFALCVYWSEPEQHPFVILADESLSEVEWGLFIFQAAIYAAVTEELLFRGLLMGWLRRALFVEHCVVAGIALLITGFAVVFPALSSAVPGENKAQSKLLTPKVKSAKGEPNSPTKNSGSLKSASVRSGPGDALVIGKAKGAERFNTSLALFMGVLVSFYLWWAYRAVRGGEKAEFSRARLAIFGSAMCFAACHYTWPSQIPLFLFGLGVGWLTYRTQSLVGALVVHGLFNAVACLMLLQRTGM